MDEVVERLDGLPHLRLADLEAVPRLLVVSDPDLAVGLHLPVWRPAPGDFPAPPGLLEGRACRRDVLEDAQRIQCIQDVEEDTATPQCQQLLLLRQDEGRTTISCAAAGQGWAGLGGGLAQAYIPLGELQIMMPPIRHIIKAVAPGHDIQKHEQTLLDADVHADLARHIRQDPIRELEKRRLVEVAEGDEAIGDREEHLQRASFTRRFDATAHLLQLRSVVACPAVATGAAAAVRGWGCCSRFGIRRCQVRRPRCPRCAG